MLFDELIEGVRSKLPIEPIAIAINFDLLDKTQNKLFLVVYFEPSTLTILMRIRNIFYFWEICIDTIVISLDIDKLIVLKIHIVHN